MANPQAGNKAAQPAPAGNNKPVTPVVPPAAEQTKKKERVAYKEVFDTATDAITEAESRTKGPRRAFTCEFNGKTFHVVANNEGRAAGIAFMQLGGKVGEVGKKPKLRPANADGIIDSLSALSEDERKKVLEAFSKLPK